MNWQFYVGVVFGVAGTFVAIVMWARHGGK